MDAVIRGVQPAKEFTLEPPETAAEGETDLEELFREHHPRVVGILMRLTGDRGQAEDIAGDVFCKLARRPALLRGLTDQTGWIYRVAVNAGFDALRDDTRRRRREAAAGVEVMRSAGSPGALEEMLSQERRARVRSVLAGLKPRDARLLLMRSGGMAYREIAPALGVSPGSVGTLLARAEAAFERKFRALYGDAL